MNLNVVKCKSWVTVIPDDQNWKSTLIKLTDDSCFAFLICVPLFVSSVTVL